MIIRPQSVNMVFKGVMYDVWISVAAYVISICCLTSAQKACPEGEKVTSQSSSALFDHMTDVEIRNVHEYMKALSNINVMSNVYGDPSTHAMIMLIDSLPPNKQAALNHLDHGREAPLREAKVVLQRGDKAAHARSIEEYRVGPLPTPTYHRKLTPPTGRGEDVPYHDRSPFIGREYSGVGAVIWREMGKIDSLLVRITGHSYTQTNLYPKKRLTWMAFIDSRYSEARKVVIQVVKSTGEGYYLHPIGLQFIIDLSAELFRVQSVWFRDQIFDSFDDLKQELSKESNPVRDPPVGDYSRLKYRPPPPAHADNAKRRGPRQYSPDGRRFKVTGSRVSWLGWEFTVGVRTASGVYLMDVRTGGQRVVYELSLQDTVVLYGGLDPMHLHASIYDSIFSLGANSHRLYAGGDCPEDAQFLSFHHYKGGNVRWIQDSVCIFEQNTGIPLRRHSWGSSHHSMMDNVLIIRSAPVIGNYDYIIDFVFHQNGVLETRVSLSGYILATYYNGQNPDNTYGFEINDHLLGNIHNHLVNFKVDIDILGTANRFETLDLSTKQIQNPYYKKKRMIQARQMKRNLRETEKKAAIKFDFNEPKYYVFYSQNATLRPGVQRGYRLVPQGMTKLMLPEDWVWERGVAWARYQLAVTKRKENEQMSSSIFASVNPVTPAVDFAKFIEDDESIVDEDLVAWVTVGTHHIPRTEDIPIVTTPGAQLSFLLVPFNYHDLDPSLSSNDNVLSSTRSQTRPPGVKSEVTCVPRNIRINNTPKCPANTPPTNYLRTTAASPLSTANQIPLHTVNHHPFPPLPVTPAPSTASTCDCDKDCDSVTSSTVTARLRVSGDIHKVLCPPTPAPQKCNVVGRASQQVVLLQWYILTLTYLCLT